MCSEGGGGVQLVNFVVLPKISTYYKIGLAKERVETRPAAIRSIKVLGEIEATIPSDLIVD